MQFFLRKRDKSLLVFKIGSFIFFLKGFQIDFMSTFSENLKFENLTSLSERFLRNFKLEIKKYIFPMWYIFYK